MVAVDGLITLVGVADLPRARTFYEKTLGLPVVDEDPMTVVVDVGGGMLRLTKVDSVVAAHYSVLGLRVPDLEAAIDDLSAAGVSFARYPGMPQDDRGIWTAPGGARIAWFTDPDGNGLSLVG